MTSDSAISVIMLMVKPTTYMKKKVAITEVGSASAEISVERQSRMKMKMISTAMRPPKKMWPRTSRTFSRMPSASLWTGRICSCGKLGREPGQRRFDLGGDVDGVGAGLLADRERHRVGAVQARGRRALLVAVDHGADVLDAHRRAAVGAEDDVRDFGRPPGTRPWCAA